MMSSRLVILLIVLLCAYSFDSVHADGNTCVNITKIDNVCQTIAGMHASSGLVFLACQDHTGTQAYNISTGSQLPQPLIADGNCMQPDTVRYSVSEQQVFAGCDNAIMSTTLPFNGGFNTNAPDCKGATQIIVDEVNNATYAACFISPASSSLIMMPKGAGYESILNNPMDCVDPLGVAVDTSNPANPIVYASCAGNSSFPHSAGVVKIDISNNKALTRIGSSTDCSFPSQMVFDSQRGKLYMICWSAQGASTENKGVRMYNGTAWTTIMNSTELCADDSSMSSLELDPKSGQIFVGCQVMQQSIWPNPSIYSYFNGQISVLSTGTDCVPDAMSYDVETGVLFAGCQFGSSGMSSKMISMQTQSCPSPFTPGTQITGGTIGTCGSSFPSCASCSITCDSQHYLNGSTSYNCTNGQLQGRQNCVPNNCTSFPPPNPDIDFFAGSKPCNSAMTSYPAPDSTVCTAQCKAHHPGPNDDFICEAGEWKEGPRCHSGTFCLCMGPVVALSVAGLCFIIVSMFFYSSGFAIISTFSMITSAADIVTDLLYVTENDFYTKPVFIAVIVVIGGSTLMAIRASWRNHVASAGSIGWPKAYGVSYLKSVELDQLFKLVGVCLGYAALVIILPIFWLSWILVAVIAASTKAMSMTAFRHAWLRVWTGATEETLEQEDIDAIVPGEKTSSPEGQVQSVVAENEDEALDSTAPLHQRVDSAVYNTLLLYHLIFESLPMLILQILNNSLLESWTPLALASLIFSSWCAASNLYVFGYHILYRKKTIAQVPNDLKSGVLTKVARTFKSKEPKAEGALSPEVSVDSKPESLKMPLMDNSAPSYSGKE